jgi:hypothetical protein
MKQILFGLIILFGSCSNGHDKTAQNNLIGKYTNSFEKGVIHFVELKPDSTFSHYYKNGTLEKQENNGTWTISKTKHKTEVVFRTWVSFGINRQYDCNRCIRFVKLKDNELIFNIDLPDEMNFKKTE